MRIHTRAATVAAVALTCVALLFPAIPAQATPFGLPPGPRTCGETPERERWVDAGTPDQGLTDPIISAHRGFPSKAPENTMWSYRYAFGAGADMVEVDVRETIDGRFVSFHDSTVDNQTDGTGPVEAMTRAQALALNVADNDLWRGSAYDPSPMATLEDVLALARSVGGGVELDVKSVRDHVRLANLLAEYGLLGRSIINTSDPLRVLAAQPASRLIYNRDTWETQEDLYFLGSYATVFGSTLAEYHAEAIVAIHDACSVVMPHSYDLGPDLEGQQVLAARAIGADGVQTNQPDVALAALGMPVATKFVDGARPGVQVCLVNRANRMGLPEQTVTFRKGARTQQVQTGVGGCVVVAPKWTRAEVSFAGTAAAKSSSYRLPPPRHKGDLS